MKTYKPNPSSRTLWLKPASMMCRRLFSLSLLSFFGNVSDRSSPPPFELLLPPRLCCYLLLWCSFSNYWVDKVQFSSKLRGRTLFFLKFIQSSSSLVFNGSLHSSMSHYCHLSDFTTYRLSSNSPVLYFSKTGKSFRSLLFIGTIWSSIQQQNFKMSNLY